MNEFDPLPAGLIDRNPGRQCHVGQRWPFDHALLNARLNDRRDEIGGHWLAELAAVFRTGGLGVILKCLVDNADCLNLGLVVLVSACATTTSGDPFGP